MIYNFLKFFIAATFIFNVFVYTIYAQQSKSTAKRLSDITQSIRTKEIEKDKLVLQEKICQKELKAINDTIGQTEKKLEQVSKDIESALKNFKKSAKDYNSASLRSSSWHKTALEELNLFYKMTFAKSYAKDPLEYKLRLKSLEYDKNNFEKEKKSAENLASNMQKLEKSKKNFITIKQRENDFVTQNKNLLEQKNKVLKTTAGKRRNAEKEIRALNNSAKALQASINKINSENAKKRETTHHPRQRIKRKKSLPWPVVGKVISYFGKTKHAELDTYIINNGIKIDATDFSKVKSIDSGEVVFTGSFRSYGKVVIIDHKNATFSIYGFLNKIYVKEGQKVSKEALIADIGSGKDAVLYLEIRQNNMPDDPLLWLRGK
ncbi:MAG: peptidoglycan DD-metalloendopeptidase family protein [Endomicrobium sp.]|jgi:septal ring factor EnvC (AmiA/AmiB activator)|nr:peptidoglycan DD-metalloendopeptidase family protein [Endomicrobium sp.]